MARVSYVSLCIVLVLAAFVQHGRAHAYHGTFKVYDGADSFAQVSVLTTVLNADSSSRTDPGYSPFPVGVIATAKVLMNQVCVETAFKMVNSAGTYGQNVLLCCQKSMPIDCRPDCHWTVTDEGFSIANSATAAPQFVSGWEGPEGM